MTFSEKILYLRKSKNIPQNKIAKVLNVSRQSIYKWESGSCMPELDKIKKMAEIFETSYDVLLNDDISLPNADESESIPQENCTLSNQTEEKNKQRKFNVKLLLVTVFSLLITSVCIVITVLVLSYEKPDYKNNGIIIEHTSEHKMQVIRVYEEATCYQKGRALVQCMEANCNFVNMQIEEALSHEFDDKNECKHCGLIEGSYGILYATDNGEEYYVQSIGRCTEEHIVIANKCNGKDVVAIKSRAFYKNTDIKSVIIPDSIKTIGNRAFYECINLKEFDFGKGIVEIGEESFQGCALEEVKLPTSLEFIREGAFRSNPIKVLTLGSKLKLMEKYAFQHCSVQKLNYTAGKRWIVGDEFSKKETYLDEFYLNSYQIYEWKWKENQNEHIFTN